MPRLTGNGDGSIVVRGPTRADADFTLSSVARDRVISSGGSGTSTINDVVFTNYTGATVDHEADLKITELVPGAASGAVFSAVDPSIATINAQGVITRVSSGTARFDARARRLCRRIYVAVSRESPVSPNVFNHFATGSLAKYCADAVDTRIAGKTPSVAKPIYSTQDHTNSVYIRNTGCWAYGLDLTCMSPWNSYGGVKRAGTLITPRHILLANHYPIANGASIRFVTADNAVVTRTISSQMNAGVSDIQIAKLDSDVPGTITFARTLPSNWLTYMPGVGYGVPALSLDQEEKALVNEVTSISSAVLFQYPTDATRLSFNEEIISGDSGNPAFLIINNTLVLLTEWNYGLAGSGSGLVYYATEINAALTTLGGGYQLTPISLSGFTSF